MSAWTPDQLRALRAQLGLTQHDLAEPLAVSPRTVQDWEQGRRTPSGPVQRLLDQLSRRKRKAA